MTYQISQTIQQRMQAKLESVGLPYKRIHYNGSQIVVTSWSLETAEKWASVLAKFATFKGVVESLDYNEVNRITAMKPTTHKVWRTYATI